MVLPGIEGSSSSPSTAAPYDLVPVPISKAGIFANKRLSLADKRVLMRFLKHVMAQEENDRESKEGPPAQGPSLAAALDAQGVRRPLLRQVLTHGVLLAEAAEDVSLASARRSLELLEASTGRYGPDAGPYLSPLYGSAELAQAFSRSAAVNGAVQILRCNAAVEPQGVRVAWGEGAEAVSHVAAARQVIVPRAGRDRVRRCIVVLRGVPDRLHQALFVLPEEGAEEIGVTWALLLGPSVRVCPADRSVGRCGLQWLPVEHSTLPLA